MEVLKPDEASSSPQSTSALVCVTSIWLSVLASITTLVGWHLRLPALKKFPGQVTIVAPNTALCFIICGVAMLLLRKPSTSRLPRIIAKILVSAVLIFAALTLAEYFFHRDLGIDQVFFRYRLQDWPVPTPVGRFAIQSAISFFCLAAALLLLDQKFRRIRVSEVFAVAATIPPLVALMGYIYGANPLHGVISGATIILFDFTLIAFFLLRPDEGIAALLLSSGSGSVVSRQLVIANALALTSLGWIYLWLRNYDIIDRGLGVALLITGSLVSVTYLILRTARKLQALDDEREAASNALYRSLREKQATEDRLNEGLETANAGIWDLNMNTDELYWSRCHFTLLGYKPNEVKPTVENWRRRVHPEDAHRVYDLWTECARNRTRFACQYRVVWPDGSVHWIETQGKFMYDADGRPNRSIGGFIEITDRKRSEQALMEAEKLAVTGRMAATLAHEINNPLAAITNLIFLLRSGNLQGSTQEFLQIADEEIRRVAQIVQKTLSFYRADVQPVSVKLTDVVDEVIWLYQKKLLETGIRLRKEFDGAGEIVCNAGEIRQVLTNVFVNAVDAVMESGGELVVRVTPARDWDGGNRRGVRVSIADSGPGIPSSLRPQLFSAFFSSKGDRGTGLGLWISRGIMEKNGGSIRFRSRTKPPSGTVFSVFIPDKTEEVRQRVSQSVATSA